jgi:hypothetical protein
MEAGADRTPVNIDIGLIPFYYKRVLVKCLIRVMKKKKSLSLQNKKMRQTVLEQYQPCANHRRGNIICFCTEL